MASIFGISLKEFSMSSDTDATDIIGGYEQQDFNRQISQMAENIRVVISDLLVQSRDAHEQTVYSDLISLLLVLQTLNYDISSIRAQLRETLETMSRCPQSVIEMMGQLEHLLSESVLETATGKFRWYDGVLVDALNQGDWIVLHNASLCNPSVLDRLNSLLEPNGSLILHEFTDAEGNPRIIEPHRDFRLFLTLDPSYGELSRAMRNRAVEIAVERPSTTSRGISFFALLTGSLSSYPSERFYSESANIACHLRVLRSISIVSK